MKNTALGFGAAGAAGLVMSNQFIAAAREGEALNQKLESLLKTQGRLSALPKIDDVIGKVAVEAHLPDDDELRDAAVHLASFSVETEHLGALLPRVARQVETGFGSMTSVADGLGKAYNAISLDPLTRSGLVFTQLEKDSLDAAKGISEAAGRAKFMEIVLQGIDRNTVALGSSLTDAQKKANDFARATDDAMTNVGKGADAARNGVRGLFGGLLEVTNASPGLQYTAGAVLEIGSEAVVAGASVVGFVAQLGQAKLATDAFKAARAGSTAATVLATEAEVAHAIATTAGGNAAAASATKYGLLARAKMAAATPLGALATGAAAVAATAYGVNKTAEGMSVAGSSDEELDKHGLFGSIWKNGGNWLGNSALGQMLEGTYGHNREGDAAEEASRRIARSMGRTPGASTQPSLVSGFLATPSMPVAPVTAAATTYGAITNARQQPANAFTGLSPNVLKALQMGAHLNYVPGFGNSYKLPNFDRDRYDPLQNEAEGAQLISYLEGQQRASAMESSMAKAFSIADAFAGLSNGLSVFDMPKVEDTNTASDGPMKVTARGRAYEVNQAGGRRTLRIEFASIDVDLGETESTKIQRARG